MTTVRHLIFAAALALSSKAAAIPLYVAPTGSAASDGFSPERPLGSLEQAQMVAASNQAVTQVILLPGTYYRQAPLKVVSDGRAIVWRALRRGTAILDGQGIAEAAMIIRGSNITVQDLTIRHFRRDGIVITQASQIVILNNLITNITSAEWSSGAIHGLERATDVRVEGNIVQNTGYAGIIFDASPAGDLSRANIINNIVTDSCRTKADCGAIYVTGRARRSTGSKIIGNRVHDFGPCENETKGIYLDGGASGTIVRGNTVSGRGTYAFQVHGGSRNVIESNVVNAAGMFLLYQVHRDYPPMSGNVFRNNRAGSFLMRVIGDRRPEIVGSPIFPERAGNPCASTGPSNAPTLHKVGADRPVADPKS